MRHGQGKLKFALQMGKLFNSHSLIIRNITFFTKTIKPRKPARNMKHAEEQLEKACDKFLEAVGK